MASLFCAFRALGHITDPVQFAVQQRGRETFVTVAAGNAWQCYNCKRLTLAFVGQQLEHAIDSVAVKDDLTFAAVGSDIIVYRRAHPIATLRGHTGSIISLLPLGGKLLSLGTDRRLLTWDIDELDAEPEAIELAHGFNPTTLLHPDTYLNKVLIGASDGRMQLWNFETRKLVFTFAGHGSAVRSLAMSPALDVVGVGLADGRLVLHNLKFDTVITSFLHDSTGGAVTALSFSRGSTALVAAGGLSGAITVWDLAKGKLHSIMEEAHDGQVVSLHFMPHQPVLMSAAADNAIKHWAFDQDEGPPRLLRFRSGHAAPPAFVRFYGEGIKILSAGSDRAFRVFSTIQDQQSRELSQGHVERRAKKLKVSEEELKLPQVTGLAACQLRERDWCNVVTAHLGGASAYTWRLAKAAQGEHVLTPPTAQGASVTAVAVSACGNYAVVGTAAGTLDRFNLQSGIHRGAFVRDDPSSSEASALEAAKNFGRRTSLWALAGPKKQTDSGLAAHDNNVTVAECDACNRFVLSAGLDGVLRVWGFRTRRVLAEVSTGSQVDSGCYHRGSTLLACVGGDRAVRVFDASASPPRRVRVFAPHGDRITDLTFSQDAKWLITACMDGLVRVWDVPSARLLQSLRVGEPVTSLSLSPGSELLATSHVGKRGVYLWANRLVYSAATEASLAPAEAGPVDCRLPQISTGDGSSADADAVTVPDLAIHPAGAAGGEKNGGVEGAEVPGAAGRTPLMPELVTMALLPRNQWQAILHLDTIRSRGKPAEPPKKPESAPFFLPTVPGLDPNPVFEIDPTVGGATGGSRVLKSTDDAQSRLLQLIRAAARTDMDFTPVIEYLAKCTPSAIDLEIRSLALASPSGEELREEDEAALGDVVDFLAAEVPSGRSFELVQAVLAVFLRVHAEALASSPGLRERVEPLREDLRRGWAKIDLLLQDVRCAAGLLAGSSGQ